MIFKMNTEADKNKRRLDKYNKLAIRNISEIYDIDPIYIDNKYTANVNDYFENGIIEVGNLELFEINIKMDTSQVGYKKIGKLFLNNDRNIQLLRNNLHDLDFGEHVALVEYVSSTIESTVEFVEIYIHLSYDMINSDEYYSTIGEYIHKLNVYCAPDSQYNIRELHEFAVSTFNMDVDGMSKEQICRILRKYVNNLTWDDIKDIFNI